MDVHYLTSATKPEQLPPPAGPEVCFIGRSNCGKSTLLNALAKRKGLAKTSRTPGRTQMINFFELNPGHGYFVDLPGYGFSATGAKMRAQWLNLLDSYFKRSSIQSCLFLSDVRRDWVDDDWELLEWLRERHSVTIVRTKTDKLTKRELHRSVMKFTDVLQTRDLQSLASPLLVSSTKQVGIDCLRDEILNTMRAAAKSCAPSP